MQDTWPQHREFPFGSTAELHGLKTAWTYSASQIDTICLALRERDLPDSILCVGVSGSLSRMEGHAQSDIDIIVVVDDSSVPAAAGVSTHQDGYAAVWECLEQTPGLSNLKRPKPGGIFSTVARLSALTDPAVRGIVDEDITPYGQRMQLLLDCQPVMGHERFGELQKRLLEWYRETRVAELFAESGPFHWFRQDIHRYWRSIRARACWLHQDEPQRSLEVNLKLRSSRLAIIAAILVAIDHSQQGTILESDAVIRLQNQLTRTPLERLAAVTDFTDAQRLLSCYQSIWTYTAEKQDAHQLPDGIGDAIEGFRTAIGQALKAADSCERTELD